MATVLQWIWSRLDIVAGVLIIPWGLLGLSIALAGWKKFIQSSGADIYVILSSLDLEFIVFKEKFINLVYGKIQDKFSEVFVVGLVVSLIFLAVSSRVQHRMTVSSSGTLIYPPGTLFVCWAFAPVWMAIHFLAILAR